MTGCWLRDNHLAELGRAFSTKLRRIVEQAGQIEGLKFIAVEVDHVDHQLNRVLKIPGIDIVLLDNMGQWQLKHAVEMRDAMCGTGKRPLCSKPRAISRSTASRPSLNAASTVLPSARSRIRPLPSISAWIDRPDHVT